MELSFNRTARPPYDVDPWGSTGVTFSNSSAVSVQLNKAANLLSIFILCDAMVALGCTMNVSKIKAHIVKPKGVAIAMLAQFGVMPLTAFSLAKLFQLDTDQAVAALVCGCSPGGVLSNVLSFAFKGDMNLRYTSYTQMSTCVAPRAACMLSGALRVDEEFKTDSNYRTDH